MIYIDSDFKCHVQNDGTMMAVETSFFDDKCDAFIEGYRYIPECMTWVRPDGTVFHGIAAFPWKDYRELDAAQREYEKAQAEMADMKAELSEAQAAQAAYEQGVQEA